MIDIIYFFIIIVGFCSSLIGALIGAGGGFLNVPFFVFLGYPENSTAISLFAILFNALVSSIFNMRKGLIDFKIVFSFMPFIISGSLLGAFIFNLLKTIDINIFKLVFTFFLIILGLKIFFKSNNETDEVKIIKVKQIDKKFIIYSILIGFSIGFLGSFLGIGGGILAMPFFIFIFGISTHVAIATSLFLMIFNSIASLTVHIYEGNLILIFGILLAIGAVIGANFGSRLAYRLKGKKIRKIYGIIMVLIAIPLIWLRIFLPMNDPIQEFISNLMDLFPKSLF